MRKKGFKDRYVSESGRGHAEDTGIYFNQHTRYTHPKGMPKNVRRTGIELLFGKRFKVPRKEDLK